MGHIYDVSEVLLPLVIRDQTKGTCLLGIHISYLDYPPCLFKKNQA